MAKSVLVQRVESRLSDLGIGPVEAAARVPGMERNFLRDLLEGKKRSFSQAMAPRVAQALEWTVAELNGEPQPSPGRRRDRVTRVPLLDSVTAGKLTSPASQIPVEKKLVITTAIVLMAGIGAYFGPALVGAGEACAQGCAQGQVWCCKRTSSGNSACSCTFFCS